MGGRGGNSKGGGGRGHVWHMSQESMEEGIARDLNAAGMNVDDRTAGVYLETIQDWSGDAYENIRAYQRGEIDDDFMGYRYSADRLEQYIAVVPKWNDGPLYRGISEDYLPAIQDARRTGATLDMGGLSSWSSDRKVALQFAHDNAHNGKGVVFELAKTKKGASIAGFSEYGEKEVLVSGSARYKIGGIQTNPNGLVVVKVIERR